MIEVVPFRADLAAAFQRLNLDWIERLFAVEAADRKVLADPERSIIAPGGQIFFDKAEVSCVRCHATVGHWVR